MNLRHVLNITLSTAALTVAGAGACLAEEPVLHAAAVKASLGPITDPGADFWKQASAIKVVTQPQNVADPQNTKPAIGDLSVRAGWRS
jgi:hypothetical protein